MLYRKGTTVKFVLHFCTYLIASLSVAQNTLELQLNWHEPMKVVHNSEEILAPHFEGETFSGSEPLFQYMEEVPDGYNANLSIQNSTTQPAQADEIAYLKRFQLKVPTEVQAQLKVTNGNGKRWISVCIFPFVEESGVVKRISQVVINKTKLPSQSNYLNKDFAAESVLRPGNGVWYKIAVNADGIHKIDRTFLQNLGIDVASLNPQHINIYGNGDGRLPEQNDLPRTDDLALNSIFIQGESDGVFDEDDYILFYAWGPDRWYANGGEFNQDKNIYSTFSYYFISINATVAPERIQTIAPPVGSVTHNISSYSYRAIHEVDAVNMVSAGQRWYGEQFDIELSKVFNFPVPNPVVGHPSTFKVAIATNNKSTTGTEQRYSLNGSLLLSDNLPTLSDWGRSLKTLNFTSGSSNLNLTIAITRNSPDVVTYLDRIELNTRRNLVFTGSQFNFSDLSTVGAGNIGQFTIQNFPSSGFVWDVTDRHHPKSVSGNLSGNDYVFTAALDTITEFVASDSLTFLAPQRVGVVDPQNLHGLDQATLLIVTHKNFLGQANRLANLHNTYDGMSVHVVTTEQIYNEFSSGALDPTAIRMFAKMFYDRGASQPDTRPKYLCLFGDGTFDPKNRVAGNNNYIPTYQFIGGFGSEHHINNLVSDDYFGMLDDSESIDNTDLLDIGIGRLLISDTEIAKQQVDKIEHYMKNGSTLFADDNANCVDGVSTSTFGDWRTKVVNVADNQHNGYFINVDLEPIYDYLQLNFHEMNYDKLYLDAYPRVSTTGGYRFPDINKNLDDRFKRGALVINYVGHGGEAGLADERIITIPQIQSYTNIDNLPLFVSATCEFTKYDDPSRVSAGEWLSLNERGGAIALFTTTRSVYFSVNGNTVTRFFENVFVRHPDFSPRTLGEIVMNTKVNINDSDNKFAFTLIGDPALRIALPRYRMVLDSINGYDPALVTDTIRALTKVRISGHVEDFSGNVLSGFNGVATPSLYDKPKQLQTLGQGPESPVIPFELQRNVVYKGKATVTNGYFNLEFITPKDIDYAFGEGKFSLYANSDSQDGIGEETRVIVGGINPNGLDDNVGPEIDLYLNNENFANGGLTDETPYLIAKIFDDNGINTVGNGIGHDITVVIDQNTADPIILNDYYSADLDTYQSGEVKYQFTELEPGEHTLTLKVWDVNNNSSEATLDFVVQDQRQLELEHVLNYPNPFTTSTEFFFEHNQCCTELQTQIQIFTVSGRLVKTINQNIYTSGFRSEGIHWDGKDDFGDQLAKGVYVYRLKVRTPEGVTAEKLEKLVLLK